MIAVARAEEGHGDLASARTKATRAPRPPRPRSDGPDQELSVRAAELLEPAFEEHKGRDGRLSIQTDPRYYRDTRRSWSRRQFDRLAPNIIVKIPVTRAGIPAIEEATYRGISINATVSFSLPQAVAVARRWSEV